MIKLREFLEKCGLVLRHYPEPKNYRWFILFNGDAVGVYWGPDLANLGEFIESWIDSFPGGSEPIQLVDNDEFLLILDDEKGGKNEQ